MWRDVLRQHKKKSWHVMLGGGDQLYCDGMAKKSKKFQEWLKINNLHRKFSMACDENSDLRNEMEEVFLEHYCQVSSLPQAPAADDLYIEKILTVGF